MKSNAITFRLPTDTIERLRGYCYRHGYRSKGELYSLILTQYALWAANGTIKVTGDIRYRFDCVTTTQGCRVSPQVYQLIKQHSVAVNYTPSIWCARMMIHWLKDAEKEDSRHQRRDGYPIWAQFQAGHHRELVEELLKVY